MRLKILFLNFRLRSIFSHYTLQLMAFAFRDVFGEQSLLIYGSLINQFLNFMILKMTCESLLEVNLYTKVYRDFLNVCDLWLSYTNDMQMTVPVMQMTGPQKFSITDSVISELKSSTKEILVYFYLRIQYFSEYIQMIWNKILMRVIETI